jgi:hypothetical protein
MSVFPDHCSSASFCLISVTEYLATGVPSGPIADVDNVPSGRVTMLTFVAHARYVANQPAKASDGRYDRVDRRHLGRKLGLS